MVDEVRDERCGVRGKSQRILYIEIGIVVKSGGRRGGSAIVGTNATVGTKQDVGECVRFPFHTDIPIPVVTT